MQRATVRHDRSLDTTPRCFNALRAHAPRSPVTPTFQRVQDARCPASAPSGGLGYLAIFERAISVTSRTGVASYEGSSAVIFGVILLGLAFASLAALARASRFRNLIWFDSLRGGLCHIQALNGAAACRRASPAVFRRLSPTPGIACGRSTARNRP